MRTTTTQLPASTAGKPPAAVSPNISDIDIAIGGTDFSRAELMFIARAADHFGVGTIYVTEGVGRDVFSVLGQMATVTERVGLGTGIVNIFSRTPTALAQHAASVMELMGQRPFVLGLGTSGRALMEKYHGVPFSRPVTRMAETVQIIDHAFRTGRLPDGGDVFPLAGLPLGIDVDRSQLQIYVAGLSDATLKVTGQYADGWLPIWVSIAHGRELAAVVDAAAADAGRPRPTVAAYLYGGVGDSDSLVSYVKSTLAWYVAANGTAYRRLFERYGYSEDMELICGLWSSGDRVRARREVPDRLLRDTALMGSPEAFLHQVGRFTAAGVDRPVLRLQGQLTATECVAMLANLAAHTTAVTS